MMRISGGWCKGMALKAPPGMATRPTAAKVREAVMSMLASRLPDSCFVDVFAGSGAMGIEALSRGARTSIFVEKDRAALGALNANISEVRRRAAQDQREANLQVCAGDAQNLANFLKHASPDIIWVDPPYQDAAFWLPQLAGSLAPLVKLDAVLVLEAGLNEEQIASLPIDNRWALSRSRRYGITFVHVLERQGKS